MFMIELTNREKQIKPVQMRSMYGNNVVAMFFKSISHLFSHLFQCFRKNTAKHINIDRKWLTLN